LVPVASGFKPELAFIGVLSMAFMVTYMAARRFRKIGGTTLALGAHRIACCFGVWPAGRRVGGDIFALLLTRCFVASASGLRPVAPALIAIFIQSK